MKGSFHITITLPQADPSRAHDFTTDLRRLIRPIDPLMSLDTAGSHHRGYVISMSGTLTDPRSLVVLRKDILRALKRTTPLHSILYSITLTESGG